MKRFSSKLFKRIIVLLVCLFILLFLFRLGYGYTLKIGSETQSNVHFDSFSSDNKKNYATTKSFKDGMVDLPIESQSSGVDQKYEKIADIKAESTTYEQEEKQIRDQIENSFGIIQYERKTGNDGKRKLQLQIGVPPDHFETLYGQLVEIGKTHSKEIIKNDKTNDYLELNARKASLEKTLESLIAFKEKSGKIDEYINLENRILEIQEKLQQLGVNLGDFDKSNEFCTIRFSLVEVKVAEVATVGFYHRSKVALEWTIRLYLRIVSSLFFIVLGAFIFLLITEKIGPVIKYIKSFKKGLGQKKEDNKE